MAEIEFLDVSKRFSDTVAVDSLNLSIEKGKITMLIGPSGCGKTTTLKMINRLIEPSSGSILIGGQDVTKMDPVKLRRSIGYVIQHVGLFPHYTVFDNVATVPRLLGWSEKDISDRVMELLNLVTLDESYAAKYPLQLSGGERQRVGLARALGANPEVLLMDEPFGAIDPINRATIQDAFLEIQEEIGKTIVFVTHDINEAIKMGDRLVVMKDGSLVQSDSVSEVLDNPQDEFVESLLGHDRTLKALSLKRAKDFLSQDGCISIVREDSTAQTREALMDRLEKETFKTAYLVDHRGVLQGRYVLDKANRTGRVSIDYEEGCVRVDRNTSVTDSLSRMLEAGARQLPVVDRNGKLMGCIRLSHIFSQVESGKESEMR
ncbi:ABC transporter ATP-binding protein [Dethiosulfovibrio salsuginis]|uniref:Osmoprotectant transport system ATP-binding protein n=1 Tax=Dethiosulfovibrio salsuginis TaxID=561720 RepID=A0A1X7JUD0_9BACT|nr:ABC transporter ATP-binding protein [Dethiosulfovibrio salsuginis]SMG31418.1 osmoprotectant transport system ATP-binding protein [Dethiosulfovibrio salsuginis]